LDTPIPSAATDALLANDPDLANILTTSTKESGEWLNALPISSLSLHMDDDTVRVEKWSITGDH